MEKVCGVSLYAVGDVCVLWGISVCRADRVLWEQSFGCGENLCFVGRLSVPWV